MGLRAGTEERILDAAEDLFFTRGISATPIDAVIARAGVSAATLYRGFASKEALLAAALERRQAAWIDVWDDAIARHDDPVEQLLAVFDALERFRDKPQGSRWCAFLGSAAEYADAPAEVAAAVRADTDAMRSRLRRLAAPVASARAEELAEQLLLVVTGDLAMRLREPGRESGAESSRGTADARAIAALLVAAAR
ncbi:TetR/AcrR family transcriptional regulator [Microbacterium radiodurans]|uniref:TetR/AcrR family transcriptional regulator n=1 Tax=Microbacterium radiodurans TaxID=661398 RepID=A0A5J5IRW0_9MICO|nr:TetR/AcrR family transcriptional regulator [Microbacterium radiodurans]KAA9085191.1 TetR/AcrR family transcriptional regulator [Microbacterium radiodurans]